MQALNLTTNWKEILSGIAFFDFQFQGFFLIRV